ncbi:MAG: cupin domain-containing protein [Gemmataceae bacterium]
MAVPHAQSGEIVSVRPLGAGLAQAKTTTLIKTNTLEAIRLVLPRGKHIPRHEAPGEVTIQCLEGRIRMDLNGRVVELAAGDLMYLNDRVPHDVQALEDSTVLATLLLPQDRPVAWPSVLAEELSAL